jgi:hypothetical protein
MSKFLSGKNFQKNLTTMDFLLSAKSFSLKTLDNAGVSIKDEQQKMGRAARRKKSFPRKSFSDQSAFSFRFASEIFPKKIFQKYSKK